MLRGVVIALCVTLGFSEAASADPEIILLIPGQGEDISVSTNSLNQLGEVAGYHRDAHGKSNGFIRKKNGKLVTIGPHSYRPAALNSVGMTTGSVGSRGYLTGADGSITEFDVKDKSRRAAHTAPIAINDNGQIAGNWWTESSAQHGFARDPDGTIVSFDAPQADSANGTTVLGISSGGYIAGYFTDTSRADHGFVRAPDGKIQVIDVPGSGVFLQTHVTCINAKQTVAGDFEDDNGLFGFVMNKAGHATKFTLPGANVLSINGINKNGDVTGDYQDSHSGDWVGFVRTAAGEITTFQISQERYTFANSINDKGEIAGSYANGDGGGGYLRTP